MPDFPCHSRPRAEWCDRHGPGDFMGHTCREMAEIERQGQLRRLQQRRRNLTDTVTDAQFRIRELDAEIAALGESK